MDLKDYLMCFALYIYFACNIMRFNFRMDKCGIESDSSRMGEPACLFVAVIVNMGCNPLLSGFMKRT